MKVSRRHGRVVLRLGEAEVALLDALLDQLAEVVSAEGADDAVTARLFPSAYPDDGDAEAEYRSLTEDSLRADRMERIGLCAADLGDTDAAIDLDLTDETAGRRWIQVLNDLRLALGTRLGVTEESPEIDLTDPSAAEWTVYYWLTAAQDSVVSAMLGR